MKRVRVGVIPAAGKGGRISPLGRILPKPMLPVLDRPILEFILRRMVYEFGVEEVYLIVERLGGLVQNYFKDGRDFGVRIKYVRQRQPRGIAHAVSLTSRYIREPFLVILGDDFTLGSAKGLMKKFREKNAGAVEAVIREKDRDILRKTCCVTIDSAGMIRRIVEKPSRPMSDIRGCGLYLFDPMVFDYIKKTPRSSGRQEVEITDTIGLMAREGRAFAAFIRGNNININTPDDLVRANMMFVRMSGDLSGPFWGRRGR
ncbi:MAG: nucleotidyltransferase family protein [Candidatus Omnitrophota bacterium]|nr:nucleotidyltransferase family protein [Candidatus Omnitrophota bacterium]